MSQNLREEITAKIITSLENDILPWVRPWRISPNAGHAANIQSRKNYRGINPLLLDLHAMRHGFTSRWWGTINQWNALGGTIKRRPDDVPPGQWGAKIVYFSPVKKKVVDKNTGEEDEDRFFVMRGYTVFSLDQVEGTQLDKYRVNKEPIGNPEFADFAPAEELLRATGFEIRLGAEERAAYYRPEPFDLFPHHTSGDYIVMPDKDRFLTEADFYCTAFHESAHKAEVRLGWDYRKKGYEMGELVAELTSAFVANELNLPQGDHVTSSARYIRHWVEAMRGNSSYVIAAASQASKVTSYLLSFVRKDEDGVAGEAEPATA